MRPGSVAEGASAMVCTSRSEEHTSELQSQSNLVCRLLLEKKKNEFERVTLNGREVRLPWFSIDALPFEKMWEDDQYWDRLALDGNNFDGWIYYSSEYELLI